MRHLNYFTWALTEHQACLAVEYFIDAEVSHVEVLSNIQSTGDIDAQAIAANKKCVDDGSHISCIYLPTRKPLGKEELWQSNLRHKPHRA